MKRPTGKEIKQHFTDQEKAKIDHEMETTLHCLIELRQNVEKKKNIDRIESNSIMVNILRIQREIIFMNDLHSDKK